MNTSGEVADLMVKEGLQISEEAIKLAGLGAKNLAAIIVALIKDDTKLQGKTNLKQLLKSDKALCILQIKTNDLSKFTSEAKKYGVLFTPVADKENTSGLCDIIAKQEDVTKLNYIMEKMGYAAPEVQINDDKDIDMPEKADERKAEELSKNRPPRAVKNRQEKEFTKRGDTEKMSKDTAEGKPSVRKKIEDIKNNVKKQNSSKDIERNVIGHTAPGKKKAKIKKKGMSR